MICTLPFCNSLVVLCHLWSMLVCRIWPLYPKFFSVGHISQLQLSFSLQAALGCCWWWLGHVTSLYRGQQCSRTMWLDSVRVLGKSFLLHCGQRWNTTKKCLHGVWLNTYAGHLQVPLATSVLNTFVPADLMSNTPLRTSCMSRFCDEFCSFDVEHAEAMCFVCLVFPLSRKVSHSVVCGMLETVWWTWDSCFLAREMQPRSEFALMHI